MQLESTLNQLKIASEGKLPPSYGVYFKNTLVALCHALEDHILQTSAGDEDAKPLVLVTFQQGKWYLQEADRYEDIARSSRHITIAAVADSGFSEHKTGNLDNVSLINLDKADSLVEEWNLILLSRDYAAMLLCHELSDEEYRADTRPTVDTERKFYGLWTFDRSLVERAAKILIDRFRPYNPSLIGELELYLAQVEQNVNPIPADLTAVVSRVVTYLQTSQQQLFTVSRQALELRELEGQASRLNKNLAANQLQAFLRMAQKVDERDRDNPVASLQVAALAEMLAQLLDLPTLKVRRLRLAGLLYRIGLAEAPIEVFTQRASQLEGSSALFWRDRSVLGARLLATMPELTPVREIIYHEFEYWDGSGVPNGLKGEEISLESRILGLVSYFQELTQPRGDRPALDLGDAFARCQGYSGTRFDPFLVEQLGSVIRLCEMGWMTLPDRPSQAPSVWLEEASS